MKKIIVCSMAVIFILTALPSFSQTYKTMADTAALNGEYAKVSHDILDLTAKLDKAKKDQDDDSRKADKATADAQSTAADASDKASKSVDGTVGEAKRAKREARRSVKDAKDARRAKSNLDDSNKKVLKLTADLEKKQQRLKELDGMRSSLTGVQQ